MTSGARIGCLNHVFKDLVQIREAQLHQYRVGEVEVWVARSKNFGADDERALLANLKQKTGQDTAVRIKYVDSIQRTRSGKLRMVVSHIENVQDLAGTREAKHVQAD